LKQIELPSETLAKELQRHLQEQRLQAGERTSVMILFSSDMKELEWIRIKGAVEKWARGRQLSIGETMKLSEKATPAVEDSENKEEIERRSSFEEELKKKIDSLTPEMARERYDYLQSKPISELTDEEYEERLKLAQYNFKKTRK
jgi:hypothetical protein